MVDRLDPRNQPVTGRARLAGANGVEHLCQTIMTALHQRKQRRARLQQSCRQPFIKVFQLMGEVADGRDFDHSCAALERMQVAQQGFHGLAVRRILLPAQQRRAGTVEDVEALFEEYFQEFGVMPGPVALGGLRHLDVIGLVLAEPVQGVDQRDGVAQRLSLLQLPEQQIETLVAVVE